MVNKKKKQNLKHLVVLLKIDQYNVQANVI